MTHSGFVAWTGKRTETQAPAPFVRHESISMLKRLAAASAAAIILFFRQEATASQNRATAYAFRRALARASRRTGRTEGMRAGVRKNPDAAVRRPEEKTGVRGLRHGTPGQALERINFKLIYDRDTMFRPVSFTPPPELAVTPASRRSLALLDSVGNFKVNRSSPEPVWRFPRAGSAPPRRPRLFPPAG